MSEDIDLRAGSKMLMGQRLTRALTRLNSFSAALSDECVENQRLTF